MKDQEIRERVENRVFPLCNTVTSIFPTHLTITDYYELVLIRYTRWLEKAKTKWELGEMLCCLVGNTMLDNHETGILLGKQLTPYLKYCKGELQ